VFTLLLLLLLLLSFTSFAASTAIDVPIWLRSITLLGQIDKTKTKSGSKGAGSSSVAGFGRKKDRTSGELLSGFGQL
jgi:hypothetical protein